MTLTERLLNNRKNDAVVKVQKYFTKLFGADSAPMISAVRELDLRLKVANTIKDVERIEAEYMSYTR